MRTKHDPGTSAVLGYALAAGAVTGLWLASLAVSVHLDPSPLAYDGALLIHLVSLVAGMGAVLTIDWYAAQWLLGQQRRSDVIRLVGGAHSLIWLGLAGLTLSGAVLQPDVASTATQVKLVAVLVLALNGLHARALQRRLAAVGPMSRRLQVRAGAVAAISQVGWWTALLIGYQNSR